jgi:hypothetical protein
MKKDQLEITFDRQLQPVVLPDTRLDLIEQFAFALQNRDAIGLRQLIDKNDIHLSWGTREGFISKFLGFCDKMDKKHGTVYVNTVPGACTRKSCNKGTPGLGVTVSTLKNNNLLWRFNLVIRQTQNDTVRLWLCRNFEVKHEEIPF